MWQDIRLHQQIRVDLEDTLHGRGGVDLTQAGPHRRPGLGPRAPGRSQPAGIGPSCAPTPASEIFYRLLYTLHVLAKLTESEKPIGLGQRCHPKRSDGEGK